MSDIDPDSQLDKRQMCKFGDKCYQKNPQHHTKFRHPVNQKVKQGHKNGDDNLKKRKSVETNTEEEPSAKQAKLTENTTNVTEETLSSETHEIPAKSSVGSCTTKPSPAADAKKDEETSECRFVDDDAELPEDPENIKDSIKQKFLVAMPKDFYKFWDFCKNINKEPDTLNALSSCGIKLVGAYEVLAGKNLQPRTQSRFLCHWRYYYDPPELQTVVVGDSKGFHIGYFRDSPSRTPVFLASMSEEKPGAVSPMADNIFDAIRVYCQQSIRTASPFQKTSFLKLIRKLEGAAKEYGYKLDTKTECVKERRKDVVCRSFHGAGIVVPYDKKTAVGYRDIPETDASLKRMLQKVVDAKTSAARDVAFDAIQELMTNAQWATDEGDFGMGLELGIDLFINGSRFFHKSAQHLMTVAYSLLNREQFNTILKAHLKNRTNSKTPCSFD